MLSQHREQGGIALLTGNLHMHRPRSSLKWGLVRRAQYCNRGRDAQLNCPANVDGPGNRLLAIYHCCSSHAGR